MLPKDVVERWLRGEGEVADAPALRPHALRAAVGRRMVVVAPDDVSALLIAAAERAPLLLRTTSRAERERAFVARPGVADLVVTSLDALHAAPVRDAMRRGAAGAPTVLWDADRLDPGRRGHAGRAGFVPRIEEAGLPRPLRLARHGPGPGGVLRAAAVEDVARSVARRGHAVHLGPLGAALRRALHDAGLPVREHALSSLLAAPFRAAEDALRRATRGVDVLPVAAPWAPDGSLLLTAESATPPEGVLAMRVETGPSPAGRPFVEVERGAVIIAPGADDAVIERLLAKRAIAEPRRVWLRATVADARRLRAPYTDREAAYGELERAYAKAQAGWSLGERVRLALTDAAPRDLGAFGVAIGLRPSVLSDLVPLLDDDSVLTIRADALDGAHDWEFVPGPRWAERAAILDAGPSPGPASAEDPVDGCRTSAACGLCDRCDPDGVAWAIATQPTGSPEPAPTPPPPPPRVAGPSLDGLFRGLHAERPLGAAEAKVAARDWEGLRAVSGSDAVALLLALCRVEGSAGAVPPDDVAHRALEALAIAAGPFATRPSSVQVGALRFVERAHASVPAPFRGAGARYVQALAGRDWFAALVSACEAALSEGFEPAMMPIVEAPAELGSWAEVLPCLPSGAQPSPLRLAAVTAPGADAVAVAAAFACSDLDAAWSIARRALDRDVPLGLAARSACRAAVAVKPTALSGAALGRLADALPEPRRAEALARFLPLANLTRTEVEELVGRVVGEAREALIRAAVAAKALPMSLLPDAIPMVGAAPAMLAALPAPDRARRVLRAAAPGLRDGDLDEARTALAEDGSAGARALLAVIDEDGARRSRTTEAEGRLRAALEGPPGALVDLLDAYREDAEIAASPAFAEAKARWQAHCDGWMRAVADAASGRGAEDAGWAALRAARDAGALRGLGSTLSTHTERGRRWHARALALAGRFGEAAAAYRAARDASASPTARFDLQFELIALAIEGDELRFALEWLDEALSTPWHQLVAGHVDALASKPLSAPARTALAERLERARSSFFRPAIRLLRSG